MPNHVSMTIGIASYYMIKLTINMYIKYIYINVFIYINIYVYIYMYVYRMDMCMQYDPKKYLPIFSIIKVCLVNYTQFV